MSTLDSQRPGLLGQSSYQPAGAGAPVPRPDSMSDLELTRKENARSQLREGELARGNLQGVYAGDLLSALASTAGAGQSKKGWAASALRAYTNAISLDPLLAEAYVGRAAVYRFLERYADAKADLQRAEQLGIADATKAVGHVESRLKVRRLSIAGACIVVAAICALWLFRASRPAPSPDPVEAPLALPAPVETHPAPSVAVAPAPPAPSADVAPSRPVEPVAPTPRAPSPSVPPEQRRAAAPASPNPIPRREAQPAAKAVEAPQADARSAVTTPSAVAAVAPALPAALLTPTQTPEHVCAECDSLISALPAAAMLSKEDIEMTKLACRSGEAGGADAYQACVATQIEQLEGTIPMPDLAPLPGIDRQLVQRTCTSAAHNGPAAYRRCISAQLIGLAGAPDLPDLSALPVERKRAIEAACRDSAAISASAFHNCMDHQAKDARRGIPSASRP